MFFIVLRNSNYKYLYDPPKLYAPLHLILLIIMHTVISGVKVAIGKYIA